MADLKKDITLVDLDADKDILDMMREDDGYYDSYKIYEKQSEAKTNRFQPYEDVIVKEGLKILEELGDLDDEDEDTDQEEVNEERTEYALDTLKESTDSVKYAIGYCFWDYGWYEVLVDFDDPSGNNKCYTNYEDQYFSGKKVYKGPVYDSIDACITEIENNRDKYAPLTYPTNIDYVSGRRNGSLYAFLLNEERNGWLDRIRIFDCKAGKLVPFLGRE